MRFRIAICSTLAVGLMTGSAIGATAQEEDADPGAAAWVTGVIAWSLTCEGPTLIAEEDLTRELNHRCEPRTVTSDDPRLAGTSTLSWNRNIYIDNGEEQEISVRSMVEDIRGGTGGWVCRVPAALDATEMFVPFGGTDLYVCTGDGDNAGLMAALALTHGDGQDTFEGLIFPGELPPAPAL